MYFSIDKQTCYKILTFGHCRIKGRYVNVIEYVYVMSLMCYSNFCLFMCLETVND